MSLKTISARLPRSMTRNTGRLFRVTLVVATMVAYIGLTPSPVSAATGTVAGLMTSDQLRTSDNVNVLLSNVTVQPGVTVPSPVSAGTVITSPITSDQTWISGTVYVLLDNVTVQPGVTVTIQGGAIVKIDVHKYLDVFGTLVLQGSVTNTVTFTSYRDDSAGGDTNGDGLCPLCTHQPAPGDWDAIYLENSSTLFNYALVKYSAHGLDVYNATGSTISPEIANSTFTQNINGISLFMGGAGDIASNIHDNAFTGNTYGLVVSGTTSTTGTAAPSLTTNDFNTESGFPIYLNATAYPVYSSNTFATNAHPAIALGGAFNSSGTWPIINNMPYVVIGNVTISSTAVVTLPVGAIIKFDRGHFLDVLGSLKLQSTGVTSPTVFTSYWDDTYGGDTNGDGVCPSCTLEPLPGDWDAVYLESNANDFEYAVVRYATRGLSVYNAGSGDLAPVVANDLFDRNQNGLYLLSNSTGQITSQVMTNTLSNTGSGFPIYLNGTAYPVYGNNTFISNTHPAIGVQGAWVHSGAWPLINNMPYVIDGNTTLTTSAVLTLPVGTVLKFGAGYYLDTSGALRLQSTGATAPIVFTSYKDDSVAGDTNADGGASQPAPGDWDAVYLRNDATQFSYARVQYANRGLSLYNTSGVALSVPITNSVFSQNTYGMYLYAGSGDITSLIQGNTFVTNTYGLGTGTNGATSYPTLQNNSFSNNSGFPIYLGGSAFPTYSGNTFSSNTHPAIALGGYFNASGTWPVINSMPYVVIANTTISSTFTVVLPVNMVMKFDTGLYLNVYGVLDLQSTNVTPPIIFTSYKDDSYAGDTNADGGATKPAAGDWDAVYIEHNGTTFDYATVKYANRGLSLYAACGCAPITVPVNNNTFAQNIYGMYLYSGGNFIYSTIQNNSFFSNTYGLGTATSGPTGYTSFPLLQSNTFSNSSGFPIYLGGSAFPTYVSNTFSSNTHAAIALGGWFDNSGTWPIINAMPYVIKDDVFVSYTVSVTVPAAAIFKFDLDRYLNVFGTLNLQSTGATPPVIFTSYRDDTYAGDTNADGSATVPAAADWKTIWLYTSNSNLVYSVVKYATAGAGVYFEGLVNTNIFPQISHDTFTQNVIGALLVIGFNAQVPGSGKGNITSIIDNNTFDANGYGLATFADPASTGVALPTLTDNTFTNHSGLPIYLGGTAFPVYTGNLSQAQANNGVLAGAGRAAPTIPSSPLALTPSRAIEVVGNPAPAATTPSVSPDQPATGNVFANNTHAAIGLAGAFNSTGTWTRVANMPYVVIGNFPVLVNTYLPSADVTIGTGATVSLPPSTTVKLDSSRYIDVFGTLNLLGSSGYPILFTSYKDDSDGFDSNADGAASTPARGDWRGIFLESSGTLFQHGVVKYSSEGVHVYYGGGSNTNIFPEVASSYFLENIIGLSFSAVGNGDITSYVHDNVLINNTTHMQGQTGGGTGRLLMTITNNDLYGSKSGPTGINDLSSASTITATLNWWGAASGPYHATLNPSGLGTPVSNYVNFIPWRGTPSQTVTTYSILGRLLDDQNTPQPIVGVTLRLNTGISTTTNAGGYYSFDTLPFGTYTVTPTLSGYNFFPLARTVTLPLDALNVDFVGSLTVIPQTHFVFLPLIRR